MTSSFSLCVDCQSKASEIEIRKRRLCYDCFRKYASSKVLKRMDTYRFKNQVGNQKKRLLLPLSGGSSSLVLLQILDAQIKRQLSQQNRTAYNLVLCHISFHSVKENSAQDEETIQWWTNIGTTFDLHTCVPMMPLHDVLKHDSSLEADSQCLGVSRSDGEEDPAFLERLLATVRTATARIDLRTILLKRLIISIAKQNDCQGILWGYSDSALAALALSSVAKGRGGAVANELCDGPSPWGIDFNYPLRDLYRTELDLYLQTLPESLLDCLLEKCQKTNDGRKRHEEVPVSLRLTSIDQLLGNYVEGQGEKYPSIMANVVRTVGKLKPVSVDEGRECRLCAAAVENRGGEEVLCYGCKRMKQDIRI